MSQLAIVSVQSEPVSCFYDGITFVFDITV